MSAGIDADAALTAHVATLPQLALPCSFVALRGPFGPRLSTYNSFCIDRGSLIATPPPPKRNKRKGTAVRVLQARIVFLKIVIVLRQVCLVPSLVVFSGHSIVVLSACSAGGENPLTGTRVCIRGAMGKNPSAEFGFCAHQPKLLTLATVRS